MALTGENTDGLLSVMTFPTFSAAVPVLCQWQRATHRVEAFRDWPSTLQWLFFIVLENVISIHSLMIVEELFCLSSLIKTCTACDVKRFVNKSYFFNFFGRMTDISSSLVIIFIWINIGVASTALWLRRFGNIPPIYRSEPCNKSWVMSKRLAQSAR